MEAEKRGLVIVPEDEKQTDEAGFWPPFSPPLREANTEASRMLLLSRQG